MILGIVLLAAAPPRDAPPPPPPVTAREAIDMQLATQPARASETTGAEAQAIRRRYLDRIGQMIVPQREVAGTTPR